MSEVRGALLQQIKDKAVVHGKVTLSSGLEADYYVDLRRITLDGEAAPLVGQVLLDLTSDLDFDAVGGLTMGADPVAAAMLHAAAARGRRLDAFVVRKAAKAHGLQRRVEGPDIKGRRVLVVEDTSTTGGSPLTAVEAVREAGAEVVAVATIVDRATGAAEKIRRAPGCRTCSPTPRTNWPHLTRPAAPVRHHRHNDLTCPVDRRPASGKTGPTMTSQPRFQVRADSTQYATPHA
ncbi:Orotate phosphoribosyltransferase [Streptomyces griseomycini]